MEMPAPYQQDVQEIMPVPTELEIAVAGVKRKDHPNLRLRHIEHTLDLGGVESYSLKDEAIWIVRNFFKKK